MQPVSYTYVKSPNISKRIGSWHIQDNTTGLTLCGYKIAAEQSQETPPEIGCCSRCLSVRAYRARQARPTQQPTATIPRRILASEFEPRESDRLQRAGTDWDTFSVLRVDPDSMELCRWDGSRATIPRQLFSNFEYNRRADGGSPFWPIQPAERSVKA